MPIPELISTKIAATVLTQVLGGAWKHLAGQDAGKVVAKVYDPYDWLDGLLDGVEGEVKDPPRCHFQASGKR